MILINNVVIEEDVYRDHFVCHIEKCKGICCVEGDYGAPLEKEEEKILEQLYLEITDYFEPESVAYLKENGPTTYYKENKKVGTPIHEDGRCAYAVFNADGSIGCGIEHAWKDGKTDFRKPISCHLYPIRIKQNQTNGMEMITYERWGICSPACDLGDELGVSVMEFSKDSLVRKYGEEFYDQLEEAVEQIKKQ